MQTIEQVSTRVLYKTIKFNGLTSSTEKPIHATTRPSAVARFSDVIADVSQLD